MFIELASRPYIKRISLLGGECLADENLQDVLNLINKIRLSLPEKTIWLYTGYTWEQCKKDPLRHKIVSKCDIMVDGKYIDSQRDVTLKWRGSSNQRVIDVKSSLQSGEVVLYCN
jgi:anaerobic ribonucleoside-triphosphate reductase activating protein